MFMVNNGPFAPGFLKRRLLRSFPDDPRPSRLAELMAHAGTVTEYSIPFLLVFSPNETTTVLALCLMAGFHSFIALNNPNGMPIEWNILMIYGGVFLFGFHPDVAVSALASAPLLLAFLAFWLFAVPCLGNLLPARVSFLLAMRYYAGNWAYNVWLVRKGGAIDKLKKLRKSAGTLREQLAAMGLDAQAVDMAVTSSLAVRFLHFEGRALLDALPRAVDRIDDYEWHDGEVFGGAILGWNFGDGHLNGKHLLDAIQPQCGFEPGELRLLSIESSPLFRSTMEWTVYDAARGLIDEGTADLAALRDQTPWPSGRYAERLERGAAAAG
jgi:hypothetical protein